jgi:mono/diheme cytochrome c family protein
MSVPFTTVAYGMVIVGGLALFSIGHSVPLPPPSPTTPGLAIAASPPVAAVPAPPVATSVTGGGFTLTSMNVDLPSNERAFPPGPGMDVAQQNCVGCHSVGMVMTQPPLPKATWEAEVNKMRATYKAPIAAEDVPAIVAYLASIKSAQ